MTDVVESRKGYSLSIAILAVVAALGCDSGGMSVSVDSRYSEYLTVLSTQYAAVARMNAAETVSVVQIFEGGSADVADLREIARGRLVYETRSAEEIRSLFSALQSTSGQANCEIGDGPSLILVAFDDELPRAGVARLYECDSSRGLVIGIRPAGDAGLDYSAAAAAYLAEVGVVAR